MKKTGLEKPLSAAYLERTAFWFTMLLLSPSNVSSCERRAYNADYLSGLICICCHVFIPPVMNARQTVCANSIIAHLSLFVIGRFDGFRFYEPYHLVSEPFRAATGGRHFIVCAADFVADGFFCWLSLLRYKFAVLDFQFPIHSFSLPFRIC